MNWREKFEVGLRYEEFLKVHGTPTARERWGALHSQVSLTNEQRELLGGFKRQMNVLCLAGTWCGDCVNQCPILQRFVEAGERIDLRFLDRDAHQDVQDVLSINGGHRVPMVVFLSEDYYECSRYGDRTLSKYRAMSVALTGAVCPTGIGGQESSSLKAVTAEWLNEFDRIQLMLRLSSRLREKYKD